MRLAYPTLFLWVFLLGEWPTSAQDCHAILEQTDNDYCSVIKNTITDPSDQIRQRRRDEFKKRVYNSILGLAGSYYSPAQEAFCQRSFDWLVTKVTSFRLQRSDPALKPLDQIELYDTATDFVLVMQRHEGYHDMVMTELYDKAHLEKELENDTFSQANGATGDAVLGLPLYTNNRQDKTVYDIVHSCHEN
ncbi:hypothetical protein H4R33_000919 [Dimargaris cristalligena]|uniref:Uncharacterized protein n=1 Tax=Dimargaris cristalligena TaxID=215637 RepID=A0A4P9ZM62_9FUNG|nr:hypothetical protein H4R33_000919 [Dimargaris cristalligena]RKP34263.1 hypothetical protein BJ085DRAFT_31959 [Dimargaris cristalligena]|eukprot:RKP34263.1 hypothetical protein BJ085DRAFT_31959 [Dimargaris cristalligena]